MKKKIFSMIGVAAFVVAVALNVNGSIRNSNDAGPDIILSNVEALAQGEIPTANKQDYLQGAGWCCGSGNSFCKAPTSC